MLTFFCFAFDLEIEGQGQIPVKGQNVTIHKDLPQDSNKSQEMTKKVTVQKHLV